MKIELTDLQAEALEFFLQGIIYGTKSDFDEGHKIAIEECYLRKNRVNQFKQILKRIRKAKK